MNTSSLSKSQKWVLVFLISLIILILKSLLEYLLLRGEISIEPYFNIGSIQIRYYPLLIITGVAVLIFLCDKFAREKKIFSREVDFFEIGIFSIIPALILGRAWYVFANRDEFDSLVEASDISSGGLVIFGVVLGVAIEVWGYAKFKELDFTKILNLGAFFLPIAQIIGRYGNLINQELFGPPTDKPWGLFVREENRPTEFINSEYFHPAYLYEQIGLVFLLAINIFLYKRFKFRNKYLYIVSWLVGYGVVRFVVEYFRLTTETEFLSLTGYQLVSVGLVLMTLTISFILYKKID